MNENVKQGRNSPSYSSIGHCDCGHHINFNEEGVSYCPLCDKEIRIEVKTDGMECVLPQLEQPED